MRSPESTAAAVKVSFTLPGVAKTTIPAQSAKPKPKGDGAIPQHYAEALSRSMRKLLDEKYKGSQREMERQTKISQSTISDLLNAGKPNARRGPGLVAVLQVQERCNVSLDALFEIDTHPLARVETALRRVLAQDRARRSDDDEG